MKAGDADPLDGSPKAPFSLYLHFPFCLRKCHYCDFLSFPLAAAAVPPERYLLAVGKELELYGRLPLLAGRPLATVYFGGGTPTLAPASAVVRLLELVQGFFRLGEEAELTIEANPGTVDLEELQRLRGAGFNRLSLGAQTFNDRLLLRLGRPHDAAAIRQAFTAARRAGFANINLDLIFGLPEQSLPDWRETLREAIAMEPEHISAYPLSVEPDTPLARWQAAGTLALPTEEEVLAMWEEAMAVLGQAGYEHYEISNYARPGRRSRHNLVYWQNGEYLGIGLGAHSSLNWAEPGFGPVRRRRFANRRELPTYLADLERGVFPVAEETWLTEEDVRSETVILGLRLLEGIDLAEFARQFRADLPVVYPGKVERLQTLGLVEVHAGHLRLTRRGLFLANQVMAEFI